MSLGRRLFPLFVVVVALAADGAFVSRAAAGPVSYGGDEQPVPPPVEVRQEPEGVALADPAFEPLPGARADFGRLGGAVYQIELPNEWNGRLVLFMHGFGEFALETSVAPPDFRTYLIGHGFAWGASSFSSTSLIPGRAADETAALWDYFARTYGRPRRSYISGFSMGGMATHIAAERYPDRFDGALALCGSADQRAAVRSGADFFAAGAYAAGVTQEEFDATTDIAALIRDRIRPALEDGARRKQFEDLMVSLTGGPRRYARQGFRFEEETNWRRVQLLVTAGVGPNRDTTYRLGPPAGVTSDEFNRNVVRLPINDELLRTFAAGNEITGNLRMPLVSLHTTGDGQVPVEQARILRRAADTAGKTDQLVQRVFRDPSHCGFTTTEQQAALEALVSWVEDGKKPDGHDVLVRDWRKLRPSYELSPRPGTPAADAVRGAGDRVVVRGNLTLDGAPFDARTLGAVVMRNGLVTPCQYTLSSVERGRFEITVMGHAEATGCGAKDARVVLWAFAQNRRLHTVEALTWPGDGRTISFDGTLSTSNPDGAAPPTVGFAGEAFDRRARQMQPGTRVEAYVGNTRCGVASVRRTGNFSGYILNVVGPDSVPGCERGADLTFRIDGRLAAGAARNEQGRETQLDLTLR